MREERNLGYYETFFFLLVVSIYLSGFSLLFSLSSLFFSFERFIIKSEEKIVLDSIEPVTKWSIEMLIGVRCVIRFQTQSKNIIDLNSNQFSEYPREIFAGHDEKWYCYFRLLFSLIRLPNQIFLNLSSIDQDIFYSLLHVTYCRLDVDANDEMQERDRTCSCVTVHHLRKSFSFLSSITVENVMKNSISQTCFVLDISSWSTIEQKKAATLLL